MEANSIEGKDFVLRVSRGGPQGMSNEFGLRTPSTFVMRASDLSWYEVKLSGERDVYAVATKEQVLAAMAREIK
ncbi:hypothetical protein H8B02_17700 [Bradyrhizobium sp. Pear77]|uniref:hypothetical protein n=1 Tax=Bradyrhizobium altum TaxID=1571202 RepID=UPI001E2866F5|nr:hypothetical protein [Bradyrhizobium altum]MCC8955202.1 hypothetical protein [Bradyrhizobium altum]